jgi:hypothetical protein
MPRQGQGAAGWFGEQESDHDHEAHDDRSNGPRRQQGGWADGERPEELGGEKGG